MTIVLNGTTGITNDGGYTGDGVVFADTTPANTLVTTTGGNVGIGTSSPSVRLQYSGAFDAGVAGRFPSAMGSGSYGGGIGFLDSAVSGMYTQDSGGSLMFFTGQTGSDTAASKVKMKIDSSGNLLVGTTSNGLNVRLNVIAQSAGNPAAIGAQVGTNGAYAFAVQNASGTNVGGVIANASTTSYATSSDYRLKNTIAPMTGALAKVALLKPVTYKWNADDSQSQGFIAHELQAVVPECVTGEKDEVDADGKPVYQGIDTSFLVATLTAALQELKAIVDSQADRIAVLEAK